MHNKTHTLCCHKIIFHITKSIFDLNQKIDFVIKNKPDFFSIKNRFCDIYIKKCDTKESPQFSDITDSIFLSHKIDFLYKFFWLIWWYHKIVYVISKNRICDITKSRWFFILKHLFYDVTKYVEFLIDKIMTPVFYLRYFFLYSRRYKI